MSTDSLLSSYLESLGGYPVFLAHNSNVDAMSSVDDELAEALGAPAETPPQGSVDSAPELSRHIADSMEEGEGNLVAMTDEFGQWLEDHLEADESRLGGQAGIMANLLSHFEADPVLYTYLLTETQRSMFSDPDSVRFPIVEDGELSIEPMSDVTNADSTKINWIFEFEEGQQFHDATAATDTRFIAAARPERVNLDTGLVDYADALADEVECALLSGFHSLKNEYEDGTTYEDRVEDGREFVQALQSEGDLPVQIEYGVTHKEGLREALLDRIVPEVDAVGMDSRELDLILEDLGLDDPEEGEDVVDTYEQLERVRAELGLDCVKVHRTHYFMAVTSGDYLTSDAIRRGWDFASIVAAGKASVGTLSDASDLELGLEVDYSDVGREAVDDLAEHLDASVEDDADALTMDRVVLHPNRVVDDPVGTVGLGDAVSVANFALEQAIAERTETEVSH